MFGEYDIIFDVSGSYTCPSVSVADPVYRQLTELTFELFNSGSAGVSHNLSPALTQLLPFTSSSVDPGSLEVP